MTIEKMETACCERCKTKNRSEGEKRDLLNRLKRMEGQVRGLQGMVEKDAYCVDVLTQVTAVSAALNSFSRVLLKSHIQTCVAEDLKSGKEEVIDELMVLMQKMMK